MAHRAGPRLRGIRRGADVSTKEALALLLGFVLVLFLMANLDLT